MFHGCLWPYMTRNNSSGKSLWGWSQLQACSLISISSALQKGEGNMPCS